MSTAQTLQRTLAALAAIHEKVKPFVEILHKDGADKKEKARAQAAVALTLGTLRFMGKRLRGLPIEKDDPLRTELNHCRSLLVKLQKQASGSKTKSKKRPAPETSRAQREAIAAQCQPTL